MRVRFHWDRGSPSGVGAGASDPAATWLRVVQPWNGPGMGAFFLPRAGSEVLVGYLGGDINRPVVMGCLPNSGAPPPFALPGEAGLSGIVTRSLDGEGRHALVFDDTPRREEVRLTSQRDFTLRAERDIHTESGGDERHEIGGSSRLDVHADREERLRAARSTRVAGKSSLLFQAEAALRAEAHCDVQLETLALTARGPVDVHADARIAVCAEHGAEFLVRGRTLARHEGDALQTVGTPREPRAHYDPRLAPLTAARDDLERELAGKRAAVVKAGYRADARLEKVRDARVRTLLVDVTLIGSACAAQGRAAPELPARLAIFGQGAVLLDKGVVARAEPDARGVRHPITEAPLVWEHAALDRDVNPVGASEPRLRVAAAGATRHAGRYAAFAPIAAHWPLRAHCLGPGAPALGRALEAAVPVLPGDFSWDYFQTAPPDQRVRFLRGDEWIVLEGMHPTQPLVRTQLPGVRGHASVAVRGGSVERIALALDALSIDARSLRATLVFRGSVPAPLPLERFAELAVVVTTDEAAVRNDPRFIAPSARYTVFGTANESSAEETWDLEASGALAAVRPTAAPFPIAPSGARTPASEPWSALADATAVERPRPGQLVTWIGHGFSPERPKDARVPALAPSPPVVATPATPRGVEPIEGDEAARDACEPTANPAALAGDALRARGMPENEIADVLRAPER